MRHYQLCSSICDFTSSSGLETQILFGERLLSNNRTTYAYSQLIFHSPHWVPYPGKVLSFDECIGVEDYCTPNAVVNTFDAYLSPWGLPLPFGTPLSMTSKGRVLLPIEIVQYLHSKYKTKGIPFCNTKHVRFLSQPTSIKQLLALTELFIGIPYVWGGRCIHQTLPNIGVDCSGFIHLLYQSQGYSLPRNARDQYRECEPVADFHSLPTGGLIFLKHKTENRINHVMMKINHSMLVHAVERLKKITYVKLGENGEFFKNNMYCFANEQREVVFGIPKKRGAFF